MPLVHRGGVRKTWRYVGVFGPGVLLCAAVAHVGPATAAWWAVWDRDRRILAGRTRRVACGIAVDPHRVRVRDGAVRIDVTLGSGAPVETISPHGGRPIWTRKTGGVEAGGTLVLAGRTTPVTGRAIVDESAGYHARETAWWWAAGVGTARSGAAVAWNLVAGLHDDPAASERTIWCDGEPRHAGLAAFAPDLSAVWTADGARLAFTAEAVRAHADDLFLVRSEYVQPFGTVTGVLPGAGELAEGYGVMERHTVWW